MLEGMLSHVGVVLSYVGWWCRFIWHICYLCISAIGASHVNGVNHVSMVLQVHVADVSHVRVLL